MRNDNKQITDERVDKNTNGKSKFSGKDKRNNKKRNDDFKSKGFDCKKGENDPEWYGGNDQALKDVTSLSFNTPLGPRVDFGSYPSGTTVTTDSTFGRIPGVMALHYIPSCGISDSAHSAINIAAQNVYTYVRHMNAGHANYEPADIMMYLLALDSAYSYYTHLCRIYGLVRVYSKLNKFYPKAVLSAMGVDADVLARNLADFRAQINLYGAKLNSFAAPANIPFMTRHSWMNLHVYVDGDAEKSQTYLFVPDLVWRWSPRTSETGSQLKATKLTYNQQGNMSANALMIVANEIIDALRLDEDAGIISGDILKAFGAGNLLTVNPIDEEFTVTPEYVPEVLEQIMNARLVGKPADIENLAISQDPTKGIVFSYSATTDKVGFSQRKFLNSVKREVSPADVAVCSRLVPAVTETLSGNTLTVAIDSCGTEIPTYGVMLTLVGAGDVNVTEVEEVVSITTASAPNIVSGLGAITMLASFDWHPPVLVTADNNGGSATVVGYAYDFQNFVSVDNNWIKTTNDVILQNMWKVPSMGTWAGK